MSAFYLFSLGGLALATLLLVQVCIHHHCIPRALRPAALAVLLLFIASPPIPLIDLARVIVAVLVIRACIERLHGDGGKHA